MRILITLSVKMARKVDTVMNISSQWLRITGWTYDYVNAGWSDLLKNDGESGNRSDERCFLYRRTRRKNAFF